MPLVFFGGVAMERNHGAFEHIKARSSACTVVRL